MTKGAPYGNSNAKKQLGQNGPFVKGDTAEKAKDGKFTAGAQNEHLRKRRTFFKE